MDFYIPISSSDSILQSNPSCFQICLPQRVTLQGSYEIALREISFPNNLHTLVTEKDSEIVIQTNGSNEKHVIHLPRQNYLSTIEFVTQISDDLQDYCYSMSVSLLNDGLVKVSAMGGAITFSPLIRDILGIKHEHINNIEVIGSYQPNLNQQHSFLNVCADIVQPMFYGKKQRQLLRRFHYPYCANRHFEKTFDSAFYFPLRQTDFETISVQITNDYGNPISFDRGTVFMLVHIRPKK